MKKIIQAIPANFKEQYLTRKQLSEMLTICSTTIHNWSNQGILHPFQIDERVYFKASDIESSIIKLEE
ncbi:MAG: helix-turn-helix domain-containing protein [Polaribacter sp.]|nr:helix-turn-helix domain-containing protein [Polaribacter sp.]